MYMLAFLSCDWPGSKSINVRRTWTYVSNWRYHFYDLIHGGIITSIRILSLASIIPLFGSLKLKAELKIEMHQNGDVKYRLTFIPQSDLYFYLSLYPAPKHSHQVELHHWRGPHDWYTYVHEFNNVLDALDYIEVTEVMES